MNADVKHALARVASWPEEDQEELAQLALEIEARRHGVYHATPEELAAIDEALAAVERGEIVRRPSFLGHSCEIDLKFGRSGEQLHVRRNRL